MSVVELRNFMSSSTWFWYNRLLGGIIVFLCAFISQIHPFQPTSCRKCIKGCCSLGGLNSNYMNLNVLENNKREKGDHHIDAFCWFVQSGGSHPEHLSRGFLRPRWHRCRMISRLPPLPSLSSIHSYALTSQGGCCPRVRTDAGWECRAQLGPTAAVYLIKTWEDPSVARPKGDAGSIYRVVGHTHAPTQGGAQILPFVFRDHCPLPKWIQHVFVCQGVNVMYLSAVLWVFFLVCRCQQPLSGCFPV